MYSDAPTPRTAEPDETVPDILLTPTQRTISPGSAFYTTSLYSYMEPKLKVGHLHQRAQSPAEEEESYPVFSPPPYPAALEALPQNLLLCGYDPQLLARCFPGLQRFTHSPCSTVPSTHDECNSLHICCCFRIKCHLDY